MEQFSPETIRFGFAVVEDLLSIDCPDLVIETRPQVSEFSPSDDDQ